MIPNGVLYKGNPAKNKLNSTLPFIAILNQSFFFFLFTLRGRRKTIHVLERVITAPPQPMDCGSNLIFPPLSRGFINGFALILIRFSASYFAVLLLGLSENCRMPHHGAGTPQ